MNKFNFLLLTTIIILIGCSKKEKEVSLIKETSQELEMISSYKEAYKALNKGDPFFAAKKFLEAEILYPQSIWAPRSVSSSVLAVSIDPISTIVSTDNHSVTRSRVAPKEIIIKNNWKIN